MKRDLKKRNKKRREERMREEKEGGERSERKEARIKEGVEDPWGDGRTCSVYKTAVCCTPLPLLPTPSPSRQCPPALALQLLSLLKTAPLFPWQLW